MELILRRALQPKLLAAFETITNLFRYLSELYISDAYAREGLVAELDTLLLGDRLEVGSAVVNHAADFQYWVLLLRKSTAVLFQVFWEARRSVELASQ